MSKRNNATTLYRVGADIGGTFTDIIFVGDNGEVITKKVLTTPDNYSRAILQGINEVLEEKKYSAKLIDEVVHASTIVTNACIELTGAKVGLITTKGFRDIVELGRGRMPIMYDLKWEKPIPLAPRYLRLELDERVNARGEILRPLNMNEAKKAIKKLLDNGVESIAVCLFNSPKNALHEQKVGQLIKKLAPNISYTLSTEVIPLLKEYERTSETVVNAYVMPLVATYLRALRKELEKNDIDAPLYVMQSSGGMITPEVAAERPIEIIESGPAAGVVGAAYLAERQHIQNLITFDMGGTTCKASIVENGRYTRSEEYEIGGGIHMSSRLLKGKGYVVRVPSIDIAEIGAGGGSILWVDIGGVLRIGPRSAGSVPGPACYNRGGESPTLTDANVVLGYLNQEYLVGGELKIDREKAFKAITDKVAKPLNMNVIDAAYGAYCVSNANMMRAIRAVSSERGRDPRLFTVYAFGGAGPTHAVGVAQELEIKKIMIPPSPGVCSAFGLLCADIERNYIITFAHPWDKTVISPINNVLARMTEEARSSVAKWAGKKETAPQFDIYVDLRYAGQSSEISIPIPSSRIKETDIASLAERFEAEHEKLYGHRLPGYSFEVHSIRLKAMVPARHPQLSRVERTGAQSHSSRSRDKRKAYWGKKHGMMDTSVIRPENITSSVIKGPVLVDCYDTTIVIPPECSVIKDDWGNLIITIKYAGAK